MTDFPEPDFTDEGQRFAAIEDERYVVHHAFGAERDGQVLDFDQAHDRMSEENSPQWHEGTKVKFMRVARSAYCRLRAFVSLW